MARRLNPPTGILQRVQSWQRSLPVTVFELGNTPRSWKSKQADLAKRDARPNVPLRLDKNGQR